MTVSDYSNLKSPNTISDPSAVAAELSLATAEKYLHKSKNAVHLTHYGVTTMPKAKPQ